MNAMQAVAFRVARDIREWLADEWNFGHSAPGDKARSAAAVLARETRTKERQVREAARLLMVELYELAGVRACRRCGCWELEACDCGCAWVAPNLCSSCSFRTTRPRGRRR